MIDMLIAVVIATGTPTPSPSPVMPTPTAAVPTPDWAIYPADGTNQYGSYANTHRHAPPQGG